MFQSSHIFPLLQFKIVDACTDLFCCNLLRYGVIFTNILKSRATVLLSLTVTFPGPTHLLFSSKSAVNIEKLLKFLFSVKCH